MIPLKNHGGVWDKNSARSTRSVDMRLCQEGSKAGQCGSQTFGYGTNFAFEDGIRVEDARGISGSIEHFAVMDKALDSIHGCTREKLVKEKEFFLATERGSVGIVKVTEKP